MPDDGAELAEDEWADEPGARSAVRPARVTKADVRAALEAFGADIERTDGDARRWLAGRLEVVRRELRARLR